MFGQDLTLAGGLGYPRDIGLAATTTMAEACPAHALPRCAVPPACEDPPITNTGTGTLNFGLLLGAQGS